jgi:hypothetical protein
MLEQQQQHEAWINMCREIRVPLIWHNNKPQEDGRTEISHMNIMKKRLFWIGVTLTAVEGYLSKYDRINIHCS